MSYSPENFPQSGTFPQSENILRSAMAKDVLSPGLFYQPTAPPTPCFQSQPPRDSIVESIVSKFQERSTVGWKKYGTTLDRNDLGILDWIQHAQEELMDGILYLEKLKKEIGAASVKPAESK